MGVEIGFNVYKRVETEKGVTLEKVEIAEDTFDKTWMCGRNMITYRWCDLCGDTCEITFDEDFDRYVISAAEEGYENDVTLAFVSWETFYESMQDIIKQQKSENAEEHRYYKAAVENATEQLNSANMAFIASANKSQYENAKKLVEESKEELDFAKKELYKYEAYGYDNGISSISKILEIMKIYMDAGLVVVPYASY